MKPNDMKIKMYEQRYGAMTSAEAFSLALAAEQTALDCGPFDRATPFFTQQKLDFEKYAALLETEGR
jgi:hypothetical protein